LLDGYLEAGESCGVCTQFRALAGLGCLAKLSIHRSLSGRVCERILACTQLCADERLLLPQVDVVESGELLSGSHSVAGLDPHVDDL
jgi:hypothetical protein